jgi:hypothetical protein
MLITDSRKKEVQQDCVPRESRGVILQKSAVNPGKPVFRWAADAIGKQQSLLNF